MESDLHIVTGIVCFVSLALVAFFATCEAAYAALAGQQPLILTRKPSRAQRRATDLLGEEKSLFMAIKGGQSISAILFVSSGTMLWPTVSQRFEIHPILSFFVLLFFIATTLFLLKEVWAGRFVVDKHYSFARFLSLPLLLYYRTAAPLVRATDYVLGLISQHFKLENGVLNHDKIRAIVESGEESDLRDVERQMIHSIIEFSDIEVREIMVPRTDMVCIDENTDLRSLSNLIEEKGHSRLPLYHDDVDNILGIIHVKDLLKYQIADGSKDLTLRTLARPAHFVPESKKLDRLLKEFQKDKHHMAIVVDEYGGTAGLVTLEDLIEEIVGDIQDEYDKEPPLVRKLDENSWLVDAKIDLHELNEVLAHELPTEGEYESLAGFILTQTGYVPEEAEIVSFEQFQFTIEKVDRHRIVEVKITVSEVESEGEEKIDLN